MHWVRGRYAWLLGVAVLGAGTLLSTTLADAVESAEVSTGLRENGSGILIANAQTNPDDETWAWEACGSDLSHCAQFASGRIISTAGAPPETVFRATSSYGATAISSLWRGRLASKRPPSIRGKLRANQLVTPVLGKWRGGWADGEDWTQLAACVTPGGHKCITLTDLHYPRRCPDLGAVLDPKFVGRYLRVADMRIGRGTGILDYGVGSPYGQRVWKRSRQVAVAIVGKIAPASGPRTEMCGAPPLTGIPD